MTDWIIISGWFGFSILFLFFLAFEFTFIREREWSATTKGFFIFIPSLAIFILLLHIPFPFQPLIVSMFLLLTMIFTLFLIFLPNKSKTLQIVKIQKRVDEREAIFHRFYKLKPGMAEFVAYYQQHPEKKKIDETIRRLPSLGEPGSKSFHKFASLFQIAIFDVIEKITRNIEWTPEAIENRQVEASPTEFTNRIKGFAKYLGADLVGATKLNPAYLYSHIGRSPGKWGEPIQLDHPFAIAIGVEMDHEMIKYSPDSATTTESAFKYFEAAKVALNIARYINFLGYEARAHIDGNYRTMCVPIAVDAGLGELGRLGLLVTPEFGPRVRLAVVTTNLPLIFDEPVNFGVQHFCTICKKCALCCPSASIEKGDKKLINGVKKWQSNQENCYRFWRMQGSDCSVCIKVCPYSHPDTLPHNIIRWIIKRNNFARHVLFWGDTLFYGDHNKTKYKLPDWHDKSK